MITRAQAEALLTLAESLEACERLNLCLIGSGSYPDMYVVPVDQLPEGSVLASSTLRTAVADLMPKQTGS